MKFCFIFGKGIDGCGVTRGVLLLEKWLVASGHETLIVDFDNKQSMLRAKSTSFIGKIIRIHNSDSVVSKDVIDLVNGCDLAIFHSYPTRKQDPKYIERFRVFLESIHNPIKVMHDHGITKQTINLVPQLVELLLHGDVIVVQSLEGPTISALKTVLHPNEIKNRVIENPIWIDSSLLEKHNRSFEERLHNLIYVGRMSVIKDPSLLCRIEPFFPSDWNFSLVGCERSISMFRPKNKTPVEGEKSVYISEYRNKLNYYDLNKDGNYHLVNNWGSRDENCRIKIYSMYEYQWGMQRLGLSLASWCGYKLKDPQDYGNRMEYTMLESFILSLPVIRSHFANNAKSPEGKTWSEYYGPLIFNDDGEEDLANEIIRISQNKKEWNDRTMACKELVLKFNDINTLANQYLNRILKLGKISDRSKVDLFSEMKNWFPQSEKLRKEGKIIMSTTTSITEKIGMILEDGKQKVIL